MLTERDVRILEMVHQCRCLRQDQIHALFFGGAKSASQRRLMLLYHHRYLDRVFLTTRASTQFSAVAYQIDRLGISTLRSELGYEIAESAANGQSGQQFLAHTLAINDVRVAITLACRTVEGHSLLTWKGESELKADYDRVKLTGKSGRQVSISLIPDSYFALATPRGIAHFFLELDRGTMSLDRFKVKIAAYKAYLQSGGYAKRYQAKTFRVLSVTSKEVRLMGLKRATEAGGGSNRFWFGLLPELTPSTALNVPLWWVAGKEQRFPLVQLPGAAIG